MKSEFQAKYLQHLVSKKKDNEGFTLIELLVVIIIVGVLAAIALPSFLNQIGRARGSEATSNMGTLHRGMQAFRLQSNSFTGITGLDSIDARVSGKFYTYAIQVAGRNDAGTTAEIPAVNPPATDIKEFQGDVTQVTNPDFFGSAICESLSNNGGTALDAAAPALAGRQGTCDTNVSRLVD
jgi:type IV pilus assembly protein PilA